MTQRDFFERTEEQLSAGVRRGAHLPLPARARLRWWLLTRHSRALAILAVGLVIAAPALAATGVFGTGSPVPAAKQQGPGVGNGVALSRGIQLTTLRVADPDGGPRWGLRLVNTSRGALCPVVGRVEHNQLGALGIDGAFRNDGLFHPYAADYPNYTFDGLACAATDAQGYGFVFDTWVGAPTSASLRGQSTHGVRCFGKWIVPSFIVRERRRHDHELPARKACPASEVRDIYFGLLGPDVKEIAYRAAGGHIRTETTAGTDGAYLVVLPHSPHNDPETGSWPGPSDPPIAGIAMRSGRGCGVLGPEHPRRPLLACTHEGFAAPTVSSPSDAAVRSPITVKPARLRYQPNSVAVSFIARLAVHSIRSYYAVSVTDPPHRNPGAPSDACGRAGGSVGGSDSNIRAGQRLSLITGTGDLCYGKVNGIVEYVIDRRPQGGRAIAIPLRAGGQAARYYTVRIVGRFSYNVHRTKIRP